MKERWAISGAVIAFVAAMVFIVVSNQAAVEREKVAAEKHRQELIDEGAAAYRAGVSVEANPYWWTSDRVEWQQGWVQAKSEDPAGGERHYWYQRTGRLGY